MQLFSWTVRYYFAHIGLFSGLSLIAGTARAVQTGAIGDMGPAALALELVVEPARILLLIAAIGKGSFMRGGRALADAVRMSRDQWKAEASRALAVLRKEWKTFGAAFLLFLALATAVNAAVFAFAPGRWPVILFLKNLTIIPFTLVFLAAVLLWLTGRTSELKRARVRRHNTRAACALRTHLTSGIAQRDRRPTRGTVGPAIR